MTNWQAAQALGYKLPLLVAAAVTPGALSLAHLPIWCYRPSAYWKNSTSSLAWWASPHPGLSPGNNHHPYSPSPSPCPASNLAQRPPEAARQRSVGPRLGTLPWGALCVKREPGEFPPPVPLLPRHRRRSQAQPLLGEEEQAFDRPDYASMSTWHPIMVHWAGGAGRPSARTRSYSPS